jgi:hypothetical protein
MLGHPSMYLASWEKTNYKPISKEKNIFLYLACPNLPDLKKLTTVSIFNKDLQWLMYRRSVKIFG